MAMRLLLTIAIIKQFTVFTPDVASAFLNTPIDEVYLCTTSKRVLPQSKGAVWSMHIAQTMAGTSEHNLAEARVYKIQE
eukprot:19948-Amphidinium_carterae.1